MSNMENVVRLAMKDRAPALYADLESSGKLTSFVKDRAEEIASQIVSMTQNQRISEKWDSLGPMECAARIKQADSMNREIVLSEMLEFPTDDQNG